MESNYIEFFKTLPDNRESKYTIILKKFVEQEIICDSNKLSIMKKILYNINLDFQIRFAAFYAIIIFYRMNRLFSDMKNLSEEFNQMFYDIPLFRITKSIYLSFSTIPDDLHMAIQHADYAVTHTNNHRGILMSYASVVNRKYENNILLLENDGANNEIRTALKYIDQAIDLCPNYAKYYATKGRLLALLKRFDEAKVNIGKAIDLEDTSNLNYRFVISEYTSELSSIRIREIYNHELSIISQLNSDLSESKQILEQNTVKIIEILSLFSGVIALIFGGIEFSINYEFQDSIMLISFLFIAVIITINFLLYKNNKIILNLIMSLVLLIVFGGWFCFLQSKVL